MTPYGMDLDEKVLRVMGRVRLSAAVLALGFAGSLMAAPAHAEQISPLEGAPEAEVKDVVYGDGFVVVYPEHDTPPEGVDAEVFPTDELDEDDLLIVATSDGEIPFGLEPNQLAEVHQQAQDEGLNVQELAEAHPEAEPPVTSMDASPEILDEVGPQSRCQGFVASLASWTNPIRGGLAIIGFPDARIHHSFHPTVGMTQQLVAGRGLGFPRSADGSTGGRTWYNLGSAYTGGVARASTPWHNTAGYPEFQARSVSFAAQGTWCY